MSDYNATSVSREHVLSGRMDRGNRSAVVLGGAEAGIRLSTSRPQLDWSVQDLLPGSYTLGSENSCDIVIDVEGVAARHCTLIIGTQRNVVKAWSPRTWVNEGAISEGALKVGDRLIIGPVELIVSIRPLHVDHSETRSEEARYGQASPEDLQQLLAVSKKSAVAQESAHAQTTRREAQLEELLTEVQASLDQLLQRERHTREEFSRERLVLQHRAQEIDQQWAALEQTRHRLQTEQSRADTTLEFARRVEAQHQELSQLESMLAERHEELAARAREMVGVHRRLKTWDDELRIRQAELANAPDKHQLASLRAMFARNDAQGKQLVSRQKEMEQREEAYHLQMEEIAANRFQLVDQTRQLEEEQRQWAGKCRNRERFLDDFEANLTARMQEIEAEEQRLASWSREIAESKQAAQAQLQEIEARQQIQAESASQVEMQLQQLEAERAQLQQERTAFETAKTTLQTERVAWEEQQAELRLRQQKIETQEENAAKTAAELDQRDAALKIREEEFQTQQATLAAQNEQIEQRQAELTQLEANLSLRQAACCQREETFIAREQHLEQIRTRLAAQANEIEAGKAAWQAQTSEANADHATRDAAIAETQAEIQAEQQRLATLQMEVESQKQQLAEAQDQLQISLNDIAAERQNFVRLRAELAAERERDAYEREQLRNTRLQLNSLQTELEETRLQLQLEQDQLRSEREELRTSVTNSDTFQPQPYLMPSATSSVENFESGEPQELRERPEQRNHPETGLSEMESCGKLQTDPAWPVCSGHNQGVGSVSKFSRVANIQNVCSVEASEIESESENEIEPSAQDEDESDADTSGESASEDEAAIRLRLQLASLFGMNPSTAPIGSPTRDRSETTSESAGESPRRRCDSDTISHSVDDMQSTTDRSLSPSPARMDVASQSASSPASEFRTQTPAAASAETTDTDSGEESVAAYMERLLARTRQPSLQSSAPPAAPAYIPVKPVQETSIALVPQEEVEEAPAKRNRKLDEGEKKSIRANLHSFREVANQSARTAVAKSKQSRKSSSLRSMILINIIGWSTTMAMLAAEYWLGLSMSPQATAVGGISLCLTILCVYRYKEIRKLTSRSQIAADTRTDLKEAEGASAETKSGPLSFL